MKSSFYPDIQQHNPGRQPDWRWQRAQTLFKAGRYHSGGCDDVPTGRALAFLKAELGPITPRYRRQLRRGLADIASANEIAGGPPGLRLEVEARILAKQTAAQIAGRVDLAADAIVAFEQLFFNVADRLEASTFIHAVVIGEPVTMGSTTPDSAWLLHWTGYTGGVLALDAMLQYLTRRTEIQATGRSSVIMDAKTLLAIEAFVSAHSLPTDETAGSQFFPRAKIVHEILESRPTKQLLSDTFAAQTKDVLASMAENASRAGSEVPLVAGSACEDGAAA